MYQAVNSSQAVLTRLCVTVNKLQSNVSALRDEVSTLRSDPPAAVARAAPIVHKPDDDAVKHRMDIIASDVDALKRDVASLKLTPSTAPPVDHATWSNAEIEAYVRKECETNAKRQRDLLEALLTARYDRHVNRAVQDATETLRAEIRDLVAESAALVSSRQQQQSEAPSPSSPEPDIMSSPQDIKDIQIKEGHDGLPIVEISVKRAGGGRGSRGGGNSKRGGKSAA